MSQIDLIAIDLDGTLLDDNRQIPQANIESIQKAIEQDYAIVICTGRTLPGTRRFLDQLPFNNPDDFVIMNNGTTIHRLEDLSIVREHTISQEAVREVYEFVKQYEDALAVSLVANNIDSFFLVEREEASPIVQKDAKTLDTEITHITRNELFEREDIYKVLAMSDNKEDLDQLEAAIPERLHDYVNPVRSQPFLIEFLVPGVNKASALQELCEHLNIDLENVMAIGDQMNDLEMLQEVGHSVAMGQAIPAIKEITKYTTGTNEEAGVSQIIEKVLNNEL